MKETLKEAAEKYAEEENSCYANDYYGFINGAKWQQERSYSEKDIEEYAEYCTTHVLTTQIGNPYLSIKEWFEQFKRNKIWKY